MRRLIDNSTTSPARPPYIGHYGHLRKAYLEGYRPDDTFPVRAVFIVKNAVFSKSRAGENIRKMPLLRNKGEERSLHENRAYQAGKDHRYLV